MPLGHRFVDGHTHSPARHAVSSQGALVEALELGVSALARLARPSATVFYQIGPDNEPFGFELFGLTEAMHQTYLRRYCRIDPMHPSRCTAAGERVQTLGHALPAAFRAASVYWHGFLLPHEVVDVMEIWLRAEGCLIGAVSLLRMAPGEPFSEEEIDRVRAIQPLLESALIAKGLGERLLKVPANVNVQLTQREQQIARLISDGLSNKEIGRQLVLSQPTVKTHLLRMFRKLGVSSRTELVAMLFL
jgi:DNA-binding CsgD family transcriptional regulator